MAVRPRRPRKRQSGLQLRGCRPNPVLLRPRRPLPRSPPWPRPPCSLLLLRRLSLRLPLPRPRRRRMCLLLRRAPPCPGPGRPRPRRRQPRFLVLGHRQQGSRVRGLRLLLPQRRRHASVVAMPRAPRLVPVLPVRATTPSRQARGCRVVAVRAASSVRAVTRRRLLVQVTIPSHPVRECPARRVAARPLPAPVVRVREHRARTRA